MGWLRLVGSLKIHVSFVKLWVSFAQEPYKRDCILQQRPMILRSLLIVGTPYLTSAVPHISVFTSAEGDYSCVCLSTYTAIGSLQSEDKLSLLWRGYH